MNKQNQMLLNKLVDISHGKGISVAPHDATKNLNSSVYHTSSILSFKPSVPPLPESSTPEKPIFKLRASSQMVTDRPSLNYVSRKRENDRIERENH